MLFILGGVCLRDGGECATQRHGRGELRVRTEHSGAPYRAVEVGAVHGAQTIHPWGLIAKRVRRGR